MTAEPSPTPDEKHARIIEPKPSTGSAGQSEALTDGQELTVKAGAAYIRIFTYAEPRHVFLGALAFVAALGSGAGLALVNLVLGEFVGILNDYVAGEITKQQFMKNVTTYCLYFLYIGIARLVLTYAYTTLSNYCAYHIVRNIRRRYLKSALSQEVAFYDRGTAGSISMQATSNGNLIQSGIAEKLALTFQSASTFVTAFIIAFVSQWKLTLILLCVAPTLIILMGIVASIEAKIETQMLDVYGKAGAYAESVLSTTRTVQAFGLRERLVARYATFVAHARTGMGLAFCQGVKMFSIGEVDSLGTVFTVLLSVIIATLNVTIIAPYTVSFQRAGSAAAQLFTLIDRTSQINPFNEGGERPNKTEGVIDIKGIGFEYPTRPGVTVLEDFSLHVPAGKVTALVGASGSGKSTIIGLLERWYLPRSGSIDLDGKPIETLNLNWLRTNVRLVQQEPVLFNGTVFENIANGLVGTPWEHAPVEEQQQRVEQAADFAFAHDFISKLPEGYNTRIGERGGLLSGGQKQRLAIARSIISEPKVLLLDEATSALDPHAEGIVQKALDNVSKDRTTIVIAHKLATIREADNIVVMAKGRIIEQGTHSSLLAANGAYARLVQAQTLTSTSNADVSDTSSTSDEEEEGRKEQEQTEIELTRSLTRYATADRLHLQRLSERDNYENFKQYGLFVTVINMVRMTPELNRAYAAVALLCVAASGVFPGQAVLLGGVMDIFQLPLDEMRRRGNFLALMFFVLGLGCLVVYFSLGWITNIVAQTMNQKFRKSMLDSMLRQDVQFFDRAENTVGALTGRLDSYTQAILELMGFNISLILITMISVTASSILAIVVSWKLGLVGVFAGIPPLLVAGYTRIRLETKMDDGNSKRFSHSASVASEAVTAIRTVSSLAIEHSVLRRYTDELDHAIHQSMLPLFHMMFWFSFTQSIEYFILALGFWYGCKLVSEGEVTFYQFFVSFMGVFFAGQNASQMFAYTTTIVETPENAQHGPARDIENIDFDRVKFSYPLRSGHQVLRGIDIKIKRGQFVAFVGASGCGKSTMIALLERYYDATAGTINVDSETLTTLNPRLYRKNIALVQQEPTLYQGTIRENVQLGYEQHGENEALPSDEMVETALRAANAWDFVISLPEGLNTPCGASGSQLSGGQRQRLAIARALIRDPNVILLDEATSALDTESEKMVQKALAEASAARDRITIAVAHRLSTIRDADVICVFYDGKIVEKGTHDELLSLGKMYKKMCEAQSLDR
ncbi:ABC transporter [Diaporthe amygdali]|uniref:ABC transporter n=1 Tax=Phomopsis amygdali TaxID=1214568 RepID=UPI0022FE7596|nr:ABC transporter [Diaporthe amygdali]KAJ0118657.1 ABC transporter [Diaporthe amygdali]